MQAEQLPPPQHLISIIPIVILIQGIGMVGYTAIKPTVTKKGKPTISTKDTRSVVQ